MPATAASRLTPYVQELLDNEYAQGNLLDGAAKLRAAYERSKKRRVKAAREDLRSSLFGSASQSESTSEGS